MTYSELLKNPFWQKKRLEIFQRDNWRCVQCTDQFKNLQVHHLYYNKNSMPWEYPNEAFKTLCDLCHEKAEFLKWFVSDGIGFLKPDFSNDEIDLIYFSVESKLNSNHHRESARRYMESIKNIIHL